jgi:hypothetical protein
LIPKEHNVTAHRPFLPIIEEALFKKLAAQEACIDPRDGRLRALRVVGRAYEVELYIDAHPPLMHLFSHPPTMSDICKLVGHLDLSSHVVSIRMATHNFSTRVPRFLNEARTPRIHQEATR